MMTTARTRLLLAILVALLVYFGWNDLRPRFAASARQISGHRFSIAGIESRVAEALPNDYPVLLVSALDRKPGTYAPGRDPFRYAPEEGLGGTPVAASKQGISPTPKARSSTPKRPPPDEGGRARVPKIDLTYLGTFGMKQQPIAVFVRGNDIFNAVSGDVLDGAFIVDSIGFESVELKFVNFPNEPAHRLAAGG